MTTGLLAVGTVLASPLKVQVLVYCAVTLPVLCTVLEWMLCTRQDKD